MLITCKLKEIKVSQTPWMSDVKAFSFWPKRSGGVDTKEWQWAVAPKCALNYQWLIAFCDERKLELLGMSIWTYLGHPIAHSKRN